MKNPKQKTMVLAGTGSILILVLGLGVVFPLGNRIMESSDELVLRKREVADLQRASDHATSFTKFRGERAEELERVNNVFVNAQTPIPFIEFLEDSAVASNVSFEIAPGKISQVKGDPWLSLQVRIIGEGRYPGVLEFIRRLENSQVFLELQNITLTRLEEVQGSEEASVIVSEGVSFAIVLKAYAKEP